MQNNFSGISSKAWFFKIPGKFSGLSFKDKVFVAIIAFGLIARVFALIVLPDAELNDTLYHLDITRYVAENRALPPEILFGGPVTTPLYYFVTALPFIFFQLPFTLSTARIFPFIFSAVQLFLAFALLKRIFPKNYLPGLAFVAVHPLLIIFGALNYIETFASIFVLLCFFVYWRFVETGKRVFLILMPFAIAACALSKASATILIPAFFFAFLFELIKKGKVHARKKMAIALLFVFATLLLSSVWFLLAFFRTGDFLLTETQAYHLTGESAITVLSADYVLTLPARFNASFWFFLSQGFDTMPFGIRESDAFLLFSLVTGPLLIFIFFGLFQGVLKKEKQHTLLLLCFILLAVLLFAKGRKFIHSRLIIPALPLFAIAFSAAFKELNSKKLGRLMLFLFCLTAIYGIAFSAFYAMHFRDEYENHVPLYQFVKALPADSVIAIHPNKIRQIGFIAERKAFAYKERFDDLNAAQLYSALRAEGITHIAATCYKNPWNMQAIEEMQAAGQAKLVYSDQCSNLFELK